MQDPAWQQMTNAERFEAFRVLGIVRTDPRGLTAKVESGEIEIPVSAGLTAEMEAAIAAEMEAVGRS
jgi:hypothetical protein